MAFSSRYAHNGLDIGVPQTPWMEGERVVQSVATGHGFTVCPITPTEDTASIGQGQPEVSTDGNLTNMLVFKGIKQLRLEYLFAAECSSPLEDGLASTGDTHSQRIVDSYCSATGVASAQLELNIARNATRKEIRAAYIKKAKLYHPDLNPSANAAARFKEVQEAYNTLYDRDKRQAYDASHAFGSSPFGGTGRRSAHQSNTAGRSSAQYTYHDTSQSFEEQFRAEAEQLRRQWQEMETDKLRRGAEKFKSTFNDSGFPGGIRFVHFFNFVPPYTLRYFLFLIRKLVPVILLPLSFIMLFASEIMTSMARKSAKMHIVYDSYGRAYTYDAYGRRCRIPEFDRRH
ncbi:hypothetical protein protein [Babesia ovis]|uniref:J domain-containing protein n=1 Tax=Babesia ovis TaxID=5869 RepID=A0A9W5TA67_BABOV|nr:hypothetical protein protein [Babesia ovis]